MRDSDLCVTRYSDFGIDLNITVRGPQFSRQHLRGKHHAHESIHCGIPVVIYLDESGLAAAISSDDADAAVKIDTELDLEEEEEKEENKDGGLKYLDGG